MNENANTRIDGAAADFIVRVQRLLVDSDCGCEGDDQVAHAATHAFQALANAVIVACGYDPQRSGTAVANAVQVLYGKMLASNPPELWGPLADQFARGAILRAGPIREQMVRAGLVPMTPAQVKEAARLVRDLQRIDEVETALRRRKTPVGADFLSEWSDAGGSCIGSTFGIPAAMARRWLAEARSAVVTRLGALGVAF